MSLKPKTFDLKTFWRVLHNLALLNPRLPVLIVDEFVSHFMQLIDNDTVSVLGHTRKIFIDQFVLVLIPVVFAVSIIEGAWNNMAHS